MLSNVEKAGLLLKAEELGFTQFAIEKLWVVFQGGGVWVVEFVGEGGGG